MEIRKQNYYVRGGYKYGTNVPNIWNHGIKLDKEATNDLYYNGIEIEISKLKVYIKFNRKEPPYPHPQPPRVRDNNRALHFYINMDFIPKANLFCGW